MCDLFPAEKPDDEGIVIYPPFAKEPIRIYPATGPFAAPKTGRVEQQGPSQEPPKE